MYAVTLTKYLLVKALSEHIMSIPLTKSFSIAMIGHNNIVLNFFLIKFSSRACLVIYIYVPKDIIHLDKKHGKKNRSTN